MEQSNLKRLYSWVIIILIILNISTLAFLWYSYNRRPVNHLPPQRENEKELRINFMKNELGFDDAQGKKLEEILDKHFTDRRIIEDSIKFFKDEITKEILKPASDNNRIKELAEKIGSLQVRIEILLSEHFQSIKNLCKPEQLNKFEHFLNNIFEHQAPGGPQPDRNQPGIPPKGDYPPVNPQGNQPPK
jgi:hypothetical protein